MYPDCELQFITRIQEHAAYSSILTKYLLELRRKGNFMAIVTEHCAIAILRYKLRMTSPTRHVLVQEWYTVDSYYNVSEK